MTTLLALIPARGGSKGVPRKNIKPMAGRPLIHYTIQAALASPVVTRIIVSTEDEEIAAIATGLGAEVPFRRPIALALDHVLDFPVAAHCLDYLRNVEGWTPDFLVFLRPTMPLRKPGEIEAAYDIIRRHPDIDSVRTTRPVPYPPYWMKKIDDDGRLSPFMDAVAPYQYTRRQGLPRTVMCDGYVDLSRVSAIRRFNQVVGGNIYALYREDVPFYDIDTQEDWDYCEYVMERLRIQGKE
ncbi:MAG: acylneuraminate cytidylyltransferase family protein [Pseudomonadota bacterium]